MTLVREISETQVVRRLAAGRIVACASFDSAEQAECTAEALARGGVRCLEIALRPGAPNVAALRAARRVEGLLVGAGNVLDSHAAELAARAGAQFATAPGTNMTVVHACRELDLPFLPGIATPSEIERLTSVGVTAMGVFPIAALGGAQYLDALAGAYPDVVLVPQGGVRPEALRAYLAIPSVVAVACDWIVRQDHVRTASYERVERLATEARATAGHRRF